MFPPALADASTAKTSGVKSRVSGPPPTRPMPSCALAEDGGERGGVGGGGGGGRGGGGNKGSGR